MPRREPNGTLARDELERGLGGCAYTKGGYKWRRKDLNEEGWGCISLGAVHNQWLIFR